jgi:hypothetical protein
MLCAILTVHYVNFEEIGPISRNSGIPKRKPSENRAEISGKFSDFKIEIRKSLCIFGVFQNTLCNRYTHKISKSV